MKWFFLFLFIVKASLLDAQNSYVKVWDYRFGGDADDGLKSFIQTADGGFLLAGYSRSRLNGDKTEQNRDTTISLQYRTRDYWIVKIDRNGIKMWDKTFGGRGNDELTSICLTRDGGYLLGGFSDSDSEGDKSDDLKGIVDYWIVKIDSLGNKEWDKDFGASGPSELSWLYDVQQLSDGGFALAGSSDGDATGDKTEPSFGVDDYWIIKTDSIGNKLWDKSFGGTNFDDCRKILQTADGNLLIGGFSNSLISGNKTSTCFGNIDYWVISIDSTGNKIWEQVYGGNDWDYFTSMKLTDDGGFILGGSSQSNISGNKSENTKDTSTNVYQKGDYWMIKTDSLGNILWDKDLGGFLDEYPWMVENDIHENGYIISGNSGSDASGDKTENNLGSNQIWVIKVDSLGNNSWDKTIFSPGEDGSGIIIQENEQCYYVACSTNGDTGGYKTQHSRGGYDYWVLKFCDSSYIEAALSAPLEICSGSCIDFENYSINASTYQWDFPGGVPSTSTDFSPDICYPSAGSYDVTLIASNSSASDTMTLANYVTVFPYIPQSIIQVGDTLFSNQGSSNYQWYHNGALISGATDYYYLLTDSGDYNLICSDTNGCEVEAVIYDVHIGIDEMSPGDELLIGMNLNSKTLTIINNTKFHPPFNIEIYDLLGNLVSSSRMVDQEHQINCELLADGVYIIKLTGIEITICKKIGLVR